jgi:hypothetical protein
MSGRHVGCGSKAILPMIVAEPLAVAIRIPTGHYFGSDLLGEDTPGTVFGTTTFGGGGNGDTPVLDGSRRHIHFRQWGGVRLPMWSRFM